MKALRTSRATAVASRPVDPAKPPPPVATAILTVHRQGILLNPTLRSINAARRLAREQGYRVDLLIVADRADARTLEVLRESDDNFDRLIETEFGDPGLARQCGAEAAESEFLFFHDADDLYALGWYVDFLRHAEAQGRDARVVYHGELMVGFGERSYYLRQIESTAPDFDPLELLVQWHFATNLMTRREFCVDVPVPSHDRHTGLGHDDWSWSCDTIAAGIPRRVVPGTISFYREKPAHQGVGKVPGIIHRRSVLFAPSRVNAETRSIAAGDDGVGRRAWSVGLFPFDGVSGKPVAGHVFEEIARQAAFEPLLTDLLAQPREQCRYSVQPRRLNVAGAYRAMCAHLDDRRKFVLSLPAEGIPSMNLLIERLLAAINVRFPHLQPVILFDGGGARWDIAGYAQRYGAHAVDLAEVEARHGMEGWYVNRFLCTVYVQIGVERVLDVGSRFFGEMFKEFSRAIVASVDEIGFLYPLLADDPVAEVGNRLRQAVSRARQTSDKPVSIHAFSPEWAAAQRAWSDAIEIVPEPSRRAMETAMLRRLAHDRAIPHRALADVDLTSLFEPAAPRRTVSPRNAAANPSGIVMVTSPGTLSAPSLPARARQIFDADPTIEFLLPQLLFWHDDLRPRFLWLETGGLSWQIPSLIDLVLERHRALPMFVIARDTGVSGDTLARLRARSGRTGAFFAELDVLVRSCNTHVIPASSCSAASGEGVIVEGHALADLRELV